MADATPICYICVELLRGCRQPVTGRLATDPSNTAVEIEILALDISNRYTTDGRYSFHTLGVWQRVLFDGVGLLQLFLVELLNRLSPVQLRFLLLHSCNARTQRVCDVTRSRYDRHFVGTKCRNEWRRRFIALVK